MGAARRNFYTVRSAEPSATELCEAKFRHNYLNHAERTARAMGHERCADGTVRSYAARLQRAAADKATAKQPAYFSAAERDALANPRGRRGYSPQARRAWDRVLKRSGHLEDLGGGHCFFHDKAGQLVPSPAKASFRQHLKKSPYKRRSASKSTNLTLSRVAKASPAWTQAEAREARQIPRSSDGRFAREPWPDHVPEAIPPDEIDRVDRELEEAERMRPNPPQQQPQEQKNQGHDAQRRIPTVVPAPSGDGSADADQPAWKNIWKLVEHYQANPAAAARVRAASAAEGGVMPAPAPRPRLVAAQAPREARLAPRPTQPPARSFLQRDDATRADPTWLAFTLTRSKYLAPLMRSDLVRAGYNRGTWRAAVGGLLARAPGTVDNPAGFVHGIMRSLVSGTERDPRTKPGYFAHEGWGAPAKQFAGVE